MFFPHNQKQKLHRQKQHSVAHRQCHLSPRLPRTPVHSICPPTNNAKTCTKRTRANLIPPPPRPHSTQADDRLTVDYNQHPRQFSQPATIYTQLCNLNIFPFPRTAPVSDSNTSERKASYISRWLGRSRFPHLRRNIFCGERRQKSRERKITREGGMKGIQYRVQ